MVSNFNGTFDVSIPNLFYMFYCKDSFTHEVGLILLTNGGILPYIFTTV